ncbi:hypothetical protein HHS34_004055 [Acidithiobacillus montserratensis]|uniref:Uncharacterized protein n=1 Tax=Acidithiobacillus montserratensis TaxID=2729135 RepID=A0ACD5HHS2_9PROT|nr:hypothetical protein [Acidithiobacillus montserratensis]MBU2746759.1 hypothetical protein [Acidithiobacillus montserratensis]
MQHDFIDSFFAAVVFWALGLVNFESSYKMRVLAELEQWLWMRQGFADEHCHKKFIKLPHYCHICES